MQNTQKTDFNPNAAADPNAGIFGLPHSFNDSSIVFLPVPWEATTSYGGGTAQGPQAILDASVQLDLFDLDVEKPYQAGMHCLPIDSKIFEMNQRAKVLAQAIKDCGGEIGSEPHLLKQLHEVNTLSEKLNTWVHDQTLAILKQNKIPGIIGGDHSVPFGAFQAAAQAHSNFGILHFDAHSDTRDAYMGFEHSHASIMHNASTKIPQISKIVQVGVRDFCEQEYEFTRSQSERFRVFYDHEINSKKMAGATFNSIATEIVQALPAKVWVSFDIDGLDPRFCTHTGTPVPGGLDYVEAVQILRLLANSGKQIIGFDLNEVAPGETSEWDANVGMRLLYKMAAFALLSQGRAKPPAAS